AQNKGCIIAVSREEQNCIKCGPVQKFVFTHKSSCGYQVTYPQSFQIPLFSTSNRLLALCLLRSVDVSILQNGLAVLCA
ncbi:MAG: hypothetical protein RSF79_01235, partial [Janthinobacterium sp.]